MQPGWGLDRMEFQASIPRSASSQFDASSTLVHSFPVSIPSFGTEFWHGSGSAAGFIFRCRKTRSGTLKDLQHSDRTLEILMKCSLKSDVGGYLGENNKPDMSTDNAHQDKEGNNDAQRTGGTFQDTPEPLTDNGDTDRGVGGSKSSYGDSNERSFVQSQFGLEGTTGSAYGRSWESDRQLGETNTSSKAATDHSAASGEDGWHPDDLIQTQGSKKDSLMTKIKEKLPGHHNRNVAETTDPKAAPKKGVIEKVKEKLPWHHGNDAGM